MPVTRASRKDEEAYERVRALLAHEAYAGQSHRFVADAAKASVWVVRMVRAERGETRPAPTQRRGTRRGVALTTDELRTIARSLRGMPGAMRLRVRLEAEMARREQ